MKDNNFNFNQVFLNTIDSGAELRTEQVLSFLHLNNISANISEKSLSILLAKASFAFLLISMLSYWFQMSFKSQKLMNSFRRNSEKTPQELISSKGSPLQSFDIPHTLTGIANSFQPSFARGTQIEDSHGVRGKQEADHKSKAITYNYNKTDRKNLYYFLEKVPFVSMWSANITLAFLLSIRWIESGHFPLSNLYESLIFLSWSLTVIHLFLENLFNKREQRESSTLKILGSEAEHPIPNSVAELRVRSKEPCFAYPIPLRGKQIEDLHGVRVAELNIVPSKAPTLTLGAITSPVALFTNAFATFSLPPEMQKVTVLVPALKSNWLIMHVSVMIISYAALLSGSLLAMAFLVIKFIDDNKIPSIMSTFINPLPNSEAELRTEFDFAKGFLLDPERLKRSWGCNYQYLGDSGAELRILAQRRRGIRSKELFNYSNGYQELEAEGSDASEPLLLAQRGSLIKENKVLLPQILDNLSYRSISLGFALLTIGILSGAVWANEAWGSYWSWDPKETWALITWLVFALYLHTRLSKGWVGKESAFVASFGFIVIWFCYLGVNLFGKGLHSYGWFQQ